MGSSLTPMIGYLKQVHYLSHERIVQLFSDLFGLSLSEGFIENRLEKLKEELMPTYQAIGEAIRNESVLGSDETIQRVNGKNRYLWVFQSERLCYFVGNTSRKFEVIERIFGKTFSGVWVSDRCGSQLKIEAQHQVCLAHVIRNLQYAIDAEKSKWATDLQSLLRESIHFRKEQGETFDLVHNQDVFLQCQFYRTRMESLFEEPPPETEAKKLFHSLQGFKDSLLLFLRNPQVPYDNNASERALRPLVVARKVLGPARSEKGAERQGIFATVIGTVKCCKQNILHVLAQPSTLQWA